MLPNTFLLQQLSRLACALDLAFSDKKYYQHRKIELIMFLAQISCKANGNVFFHSYPDLQQSQRQPHLLFQKKVLPGLFFLS